jgi:DNA-binding CsgD family transcriptional regulator
MSGITPSSGGRDRRALTDLNHAGSAENRRIHAVDPWIGRCVVRIDALSQREQEVLRLLGRGLENRAIAMTLGIAERTVKQHVTRILTKLGCQSRLQAGLVAFAAHSVVSVQPSTPLSPSRTASINRILNALPGSRARKLKLPVPRSTADGSTHRPA